MVTFVLPPILPDNVKLEAPFASVLLVTTYFNITILPSATFTYNTITKVNFKFYHLILVKSKL